MENSSQRERPWKMENGSNPNNSIEGRLCGKTSKVHANMHLSCVVVVGQLRLIDAIWPNMHLSRPSVLSSKHECLSSHRALSHHPQFETDSSYREELSAEKKTSPKKMQNFPSCYDAPSSEILNFPPKFCRQQRNAQCARGTSGFANIQNMGYAHNSAFRSPRKTLLRIIAP